MTNPTCFCLSVQWQSVVYPLGLLLLCKCTKVCQATSMCKHCPFNASDSVICDLCSQTPAFLYKAHSTPYSVFCYMCVLCFWDLGCELCLNKAASTDHAKPAWLYYFHFSLTPELCNVLNWCSVGVLSREIGKKNHPPTCIQIETVSPWLCEK